MAATRVAVVTGSNKGLGFAIVRGLCKQFDGHVYLTARDVGRGQKAVAELQKEGLDPKFHQLDITDPASVQSLKEYLLKNYGGLDVLVNNVGVAYLHDVTTPMKVQITDIMKTNTWCTFDVCKALFPILRPHARVVSIASYLSTLSLRNCSPEIKKKVRSVQTLQDVESLMKDFEVAALKGGHTQKGWDASAYGISKLAITMATRVQQAELDKDTSRPDIVVNCCCPGLVATDMTFGNKTGKTPDEGADTPLYLALLPANIPEPRGAYLEERIQHDWEASDDDMKIIRERIRKYTMAM